MFKPSSGHKHGWAPALCLCEHCSELVLMMRCPAVDSRGRQCGTWRGHRNQPHLLLVDTTFMIALERVDRARWGEMPTWVERTELEESGRFIAGRPTLLSGPASPSRRRARPA